MQKYITEANVGVIRKKYDIPQNSKILLTVARLEAEKNYFRLFELVASLPKEFVLIALGRGSLLESLTAKAQELGISDRVFFAGFVHRDEIWNYYKDADVFVLISKAEALGVVFWEAMYVDVPVVGSDIEGIRETVGTDGDRGKIWKDTDGIEGFRKCISFCTTPSDERHVMLERAKSFVEAQISNTITINDLPFLK